MAEPMSAIVVRSAFLALLSIGLLECAMPGASQENAGGGGPSPVTTTQEPIVERRSITNPLWFPFYESVGHMLQAFPIVAIGTVAGIEMPYDPRPGLLGREEEAAALMMKDPAGGTISPEILARPPGNGTALYSVRIIDPVIGEKFAKGDVIYVAQPGGVFEGIAYESFGDPVIEVGSTYLFFLSSSTIFAEKYGATYEGPPFGRFLAKDGALQPVHSLWGSDCTKCPLADLLWGRALEDAIAAISTARDATASPRSGDND
jgi:hypothetical protein